MCEKIRKFEAYKTTDERIFHDRLKAESHQSLVDFKTHLENPSNNTYVDEDIDEEFESLIEFLTSNKEQIILFLSKYKG